MRRTLWLLLVVLLLGGSLPSKASAQDDVYVSYQDFYDSLSPYGQWINDSEYGYVWVPNEDDDFRPYFTRGHWVMTDYGNTWVSEYPWGWACFHYGRWIYNGYYGWVWIPGYEWGPGWVAWRWGGGYCGWAPLYPGVAWVGYEYTCPDDWWIFMHPRYLYRPRYHNPWRSDFFRGPHHTHVLITRTNFVAYTHQGVNTTTRYYSGPRVADVQQVTRQQVKVYQVGNNSVRGADHINNNVVNIYHPVRIEQVTRSGTRPVPVHVVQAPAPVNRRGDVRTNWDQPHPFRQEMQRQNPAWNRPFMRNAPPYNSRLTPPGQQNNPKNPGLPTRPSSPNPRQNNRGPVRQPAMNPGIPRQPQQNPTPRPGRR